MILKHPKVPTLVSSVDAQVSYINILSLKHAMDTLIDVHPQGGEIHEEYGKQNRKSILSTEKQRKK